MPPIFGAFKRHYRKTKDIFRAMEATGSFGFESRYSVDQGIQAEVHTPDTHLTVRFSVLMRRFLEPGAPLYYETVWLLLQDQFRDEIPQEAAEAFKKLATTLRAEAGFTFWYNDEELSPEQIYHMVANGEYFNREEKARGFLASISEIPMARPLIWFQFYDYMVAGLQIASLIFDVIQHIEQTEAFRGQLGEPTEPSNRCIFCLTTTGKFISEEHVIPESLGNPEWLLPSGYVCDACNNGILSRLDNELASSPLFAFSECSTSHTTRRGDCPRLVLEA